MKRNNTNIFNISMEIISIFTIKVLFFFLVTNHLFVKKRNNEKRKEFSFPLIYLSNINCTQFLIKP